MALQLKIAAICLAILLPPAVASYGRREPKHPHWVTAPHMRMRTSRAALLAQMVQPPNVWDCGVLTSDENKWRQDFINSHLSSPVEFLEWRDEQLGIIFAIDRRDRYVWDKRIYRPVPRGETRLAYYWWELRRWLTE